MNASSVEIAGMRTLVVGPEDPVGLFVVMLHGYAMVPEDLSPFARSIGVHARFFLPEGPEVASPSGRGWWDIDQAARTRALESGPRDLYLEHPVGAPAARTRLIEFLEEIRRRWGEHPVALVGFSQGGMLACDTVLREHPRVAALALLSSSRIAADEWRPLAQRVRGLPVLVSHGQKDSDLAFAAGERLRDMLVDAGADVSWVPFQEGHEIPLVVWRGVRTLLSSVPRAAHGAAHD
jgi:phospholipase/carboxylesterase